MSDGDPVPVLGLSMEVRTVLGRRRESVTLLTQVSATLIDDNLWK